MNDLQKAQAFLNSRNFKIEQLAKQIGCSSRQISKYISGEAKLEGAKWSIIQQLAHLYDQKKYHDLSDSPDFLQFITKMGAWFQEASSSNLLPLPVVKKMSTAFTKNVDLMDDIYKEFCKSQNKE